MQYVEGYLAFLDILGFSKFVENEDNGESTADLFKFIRNFSRFFNTSSKLNVNVSFFSDTIIITSNDLDDLIIPIYMIETHLKKSLGLLFRGGMVYGKYYHKDDVTFGPAVVSGYVLEKKAVYSRILIDDTIKIEEGNIFFFDDIDGYKCFNPYGMFFTEIMSISPNGISYPNDINKELIEKFSTKRIELLNQINKHKGTAVIDKYLWRIRAFNHICKYVADIPLNQAIYEDIKYTISENFKNQILELSISENDYID